MEIHYGYTIWATMDKQTYENNGHNKTEDFDGDSVTPGRFKFLVQPQDTDSHQRPIKHYAAEANRKMLSS